MSCRKVVPNKLRQPRSQSFSPPRRGRPREGCSEETQTSDYIDSMGLRGFQHDRGTEGREYPGYEVAVMEA